MENLFVVQGKDRHARAAASIGLRFDAIELGGLDDGLDGGGPTNTSARRHLDFLRDRIDKKANPILQRQSMSQSAASQLDPNHSEELYTSIIEFRIHPGREADFIRAFDASGMLVRPRAIDGFVGGQLLQDRTNPTRFTVVATWRTPEAYVEWGEKSQIGADEQALLMLRDCVAELIPGRLFSAV